MVANKGTHQGDVTLSSKQYFSVKICCVFYLIWVLLLSVQAVPLTYQLLRHVEGFLPLESLVGLTRRTLRTVGRCQALQIKLPRRRIDEMGQNGPHPTPRVIRLMGHCCNFLPSSFPTRLVPEPHKGWWSQRQHPINTIATFALS